MSSNTSDKVTNIIIADDHEIIADGLEGIINNIPAFKVIAKATDANRLLQILNRVEPDIVLVDVQLPDIGGIAAARLIKNRLPRIKIALISTHYNSAIKKFISESDINGFFSKKAGSASLAGALQKIAAGGQAIVTSAAKQQALPANNGQEVQRRHKLTKTEVEIIHLVAAGYSTKMIAATRERSHVTIEKHRGNIMRKLSAKNMVEVIAYATKQGLI